MPNWNVNALEVSGDEKEIKRLIKFVASEKNDFDFNKVTPYPKEFADADKAYAKLSDEEKMKDKTLKDGYNNGGYDWCNENWGTKWNSVNAYLAEEKESAIFDFDTAWSPSLPITEKLSALFPTLVFVHKYEEGNMDFSGFVKYENGNIVDEKDGGYDDYPISDHDED